MANPLRVPIDQLDFTLEEEAFWEGELFTGVAYEYFPDGPLWEETPNCQGRPEGLNRSWYRSGQLEAERPYHHGILHGVARFWNEDGRIHKEITYDLGLIVRAKAWDTTGTLIYEYERHGRDEPQGLHDL